MEMIVCAGESFEVTGGDNKEAGYIQILERGIGVVRRVWVTRWELDWVCKALVEASKDKWWLAYLREEGCETARGQCFGEGPRDGYRPILGEGPKEGFVSSLGRGPEGGVRLECSRDEEIKGGRGVMEGFHLGFRAGGDGKGTMFEGQGSRIGWRFWEEEEDQYFKQLGELSMCCNDPTILEKEQQYEEGKATARHKSTENTNNDSKWADSEEEEGQKSVLTAIWHSRPVSQCLCLVCDSIEADRDDPSQPLVTAPFGHASQEIVNLLLCGQAVANVFDGRMDLGGGMFVKGISTTVEVGFLTLLESLNFCKVGQHLKCPKWPIWVVGSESHYTVLFSLDTSVQDENELEGRETQIRRAFDAQDQSGGGGFISVEGLQQVLRETSINLPAEKLDHLCSTGFIVWSEFWQVLLDLDKSLGGLKDSTGLMGKKVFDLYHFNGIAKSVSSGNQAYYGGETPAQRPRLTKLRVSVPPRWTPEEFMADVAVSSGSGGNVSSGKDTVDEVAKPEPSQHAPLVDCIRTRWARANCNWVGDPPSIV
ncbi:hypothetical protein F0562_027531 [Nyssa sinensis]|uniref:ubiquitinyl hydrolase 1 n=1 Tax=Nyssa sinensis TaxID=561372 RepID=A0A5J5B5C0_9ASTE|nr:hypothetical protein F0562_027531 [Nyssa sinensis]